MAIDSRVQCATWDINGTIIEKSQCFGAGECSNDGYCLCRAGWSVRGPQLLEGPPWCNTNSILLHSLQGIYLIIWVTAFLIFFKSVGAAARRRHGAARWQLLFKATPILCTHVSSFGLCILWFKNDPQYYLESPLVTALMNLGMAFGEVGQVIFLLTFRKRVRIIAMTHDVWTRPLLDRVFQTNRSLLAFSFCILGCSLLTTLGSLTGDLRLVQAGFLTMAIGDAAVTWYTWQIMTHFAHILQSTVTLVPSAVRSNRYLTKMLWRCKVLMYYDLIAQGLMTIFHLVIGMGFWYILPVSEYIEIVFITVGMSDILVHSCLSVLRRRHYRATVFVKPRLIVEEVAKGAGESVVADEDPTLDTTTERNTPSVEIIDL